MALKNNLDAETVAAKVAGALTRHLDGVSDARVHGVEFPSTNGMSNETLLFEASWTAADGPQRECLVARVQPAGPAVFPRYDLGLEFTVMSALARGTDVAVPRMFFHEPDPDVLGAPFLVMARVEGRVPSDDPPFTTTGWVLDLTPGEQEELHRNGLRTMGLIHAVHLDQVGLGQLRDHPESGVDGQLSFWRDTFGWASEGQPNPVVEAALDWAEGNRPNDTGAPVLNWGDARIGNMLFAGDLTVAAVLDWEMVSVGPRELDLGWWLLMLRYYSESLGAPQLPGFPTRDEVIAEYENIAGVQVRNLHYYEVLAALRLSILMHRAGNLMISAGQLPPDAPMRLSNPASHLLARLLDLPAPTGEAQSFVGNR
ncbi:phosphotransferase family protein [Mycobacterium talmoniae]|uniref:Phosphotransferase n=1 Tax=Mycobacterium talmoniae TaxID=1858794 RepID=A0A1S1NPE8_9MYCO|nr:MULTISPECIES: phosphotransferase family protein [Mycobacterium]OHV05226.1 phosphotransferase [Mycobacterium talmoniae]PQM45361.1 Putative aminoglycoside phosphotransferase [Mycobacterium talmoniae]TDH48341.1 phosphotransferase family protein [Mycobacterium eburneum]